MAFILHQFAFILTVFGLFFFPGSMILSAFLKRKLPILSSFEDILLSFALSLSMLDFGMLFLSRIHIPITALSIVGLEVALTAPAIIRLATMKRSHSPASPATIGNPFSKKDGFLFLGIFALAIFIKSVYLWDTIIPTSTDLGHHMFWAKKIVQTGSVPSYEKMSVSFGSTKNGEDTLTDPQPIDDFIVGEHLPFAATALVSRSDFISAFPSLLLLLINILTLLALAALGYRLFENIFSSEVLARRGMIAVLLFVGPLWALSSPEAKYVSGGVIGNLFGNLLIPIIILCFFRALQERNSALLGFAILFTGTLAFTHHLSTFVFLFVSAFILLTMLLFSFFRKSSDRQFSEIREWIGTFLSPFPIFVALSLIAITFLVYTPTYLHSSAINTAVGTPSKATREGLTFDEIAQNVGGSRLGLEIIGIAIILSASKRNRLGSIIIVAWGAGLIAMTLFPGALFIDIPSNRIGTYNTFPASLLAAFAFTALFMRRVTDKEESPEEDFNRRRLLRWSFGIFLVSVMVGGFFDNAGSMPSKSNANEATQTYAISSWLAKNTEADEWILKDHNYIIADSWMKLFFMRDYSYPLSRGLFQRYSDDTKAREQCTLLMISAPNTPKGRDCFRGTGVKVVVVNPHVDSLQFGKTGDFSLLYLSNDLAAYKRNSEQTLGNAQN